MIRRTLLVTAITLALLLALFAPAAGAQGAPTCAVDAGVVPIPDVRPLPTVIAVENDDLEAQDHTEPHCNDALVYPGPFTNAPVTPTGPHHVPSPVAVPAADPAPAAAEADAGSGLAHSGSESVVLAYLGTGLVAFGAVALGSRRKFL